MRLCGSVEAVPYRDGTFAVMSVAGPHGNVSVSGDTDVACPGMPFDGEVEHRSGSADRQYGEQHKLISLVDPGREWRRASGVWSWLSAGGGGMELAANVLIRAFGSQLPDVLVRDQPAVAQALASAYADEAERAAETLSGLSLAILATADLGERGLDWLARRLTARFGTHGPFLARQDPRFLISSGIASAAALAKSGAAGSPEDLVAGVCEWECRSAGRDRVSANALERAVQTVLGDSAAAAIKAAAAGGAVHGLGRQFVPAGTALAARSLAGSLEAITGGDMPPGATLRPGVTCVIAPPEADLAWLDADVSRCKDAGVPCEVVYPDERGSLRCRSGPLRVSGGGGDGAVVIVLDAHRITFSTAARIALDAKGARALAFVGDDQLWCPGRGDHLVADLAAWGKIPVVRLNGAGSAYMARDPEVDILHLPGVVLRDDAPVGTMRTWRKGPASSGSAKPGRVVMLAEDHGDIGVGAMGEIVSPDGRSHAHVRFGVGASQRVPLWKLAGSVPFGWLPGVKADALWLTDRAARSTWLAALAAADTLYVTETARSVLDDWGLGGASLLASLGGAH